jgi:hypothetical protein
MYQCFQIRLPQFLDFYPSKSVIRLFGKEYTIREGHPYINIYNDFRRMFGSANVFTAILEVKKATSTTRRRSRSWTR